MRERNAIIAMIRYSIFSTVAFMLRQATQNEKFLNTTLTKLFISFIFSIATFMFNGKIIPFADGTSAINSVTISFHNTILYINYSLFLPATAKKAEFITNLFTIQVSFLLLSLLPACWTAFIFRLFHCFAIFQVFVVFLIKKKVTSLYNHLQFLSSKQMADCCPCVAAISTCVAAISTH